MRGRRPAGPEYVDHLPGSDLAKLRLRVVLETIAGTCRVQQACERLGICEQRFHQLREEAMTAALAGLEPGTPGRPARILAPAEQEVHALQEQLADKDLELRAAQARVEIALTVPRVLHQPVQADEPEKKTT